MSTALDEFATGFCGVCGKDHCYARRFMAPDEKGVLHERPRTDPIGKWTCAWCVKLNRDEHGRAEPTDEPSFIFGRRG